MMNATKSHNGSILLSSKITKTSKKKKKKILSALPFHNIFIEFKEKKKKKQNTKFY